MAGLALRPAFLVLQTFANSCVNHLQRANYEEGPWVEELENLLQDSLASMLTFSGDPVVSLSQTQRTIARMRLRDGGCSFGVYQPAQLPPFVAARAKVSARSPGTLAATPLPASRPLARA